MNTAKSNASDRPYHPLSKPRKLAKSEDKNSLSNRLDLSGLDSCFNGSKNIPRHRGMRKAKKKAPVSNSRIKMIYLSAEKDPVYEATLQVNGNPVKFEVDTGSGVTIVNIKGLTKIPPLSPVTAPLKDYNGDIIKTEGIFTADVEFGGKRFYLPMYVIKDKESLLGRNCINKMGKLICHSKNSNGDSNGGSNGDDFIDEIIIKRRRIFPVKAPLSERDLETYEMVGLKKLCNKLLAKYECMK